MSPELTQYFDRLEETFGTEGWRILVDEALKQIYQLQADALEAKSWDDVLVKRGQALQLQTLVDLQEITNTARRATEAAEQEADADAAV